MKIIYEADDGTRFDDQFDCEFYEEFQRHPHLKEVTFYDEKGKAYTINDDRFDYFFDEQIYYDCYEIDIHNKEELADVIWLGEYNGWCEFYEFFNEPGHWVRKEDDMGNGYWEKVK